MGNTHLCITAWSKNFPVLFSLFCELLPGITDAAQDAGSIDLQAFLPITSPSTVSLLQVFL